MAFISPNKVKASDWLRVMEEAHKIGMRTTAAMMFGHVESDEDIDYAMVYSRGIG